MELKLADDWSFVSSKCELPCWYIEGAGFCLVVIEQRLRHNLHNTILHAQQSDQFLSLSQSKELGSVCDVQTLV